MFDTQFESYHHIVSETIHENSEIKTQLNFGPQTPHHIFLFNHHIFMFLHVYSLLCFYVRTAQITILLELIKWSKTKPKLH